MTAAVRAKSMFVLTKRQREMAEDEQPEIAAALTAVLREAKPNWKERDLVVVQWKLAKAGICTVHDMLKALRTKGEGSLTARLKSIGQKTFTEETLRKLREAAANSEEADTPGGQMAPDLAALAAANALAEAPTAVQPAAFAALRPRDHLQDLFTPSSSRRTSKVGPAYFNMKDEEEEDLADDEAQERRKSSIYRMYADVPPEDLESKDCETPRPKSGRVSFASCAPGLSGDFAEWLDSRKPIHRFDHHSTGLAWEYPLAKSEKRELLLLQVAAGEEQAAEDAFLLRVNQSWAKKPARRSSVSSSHRAAFQAARRRRKSSLR